MSLQLSNVILHQLVKDADQQLEVKFRESALTNDASTESLVAELHRVFNAKAGKRVSVVPDDAWAALRAHRWPGNVRELRNVIERGVLFADGDTLPTEWLQLEPRAGGDGGDAAAVEGDVMSLPLDGTMALDDMEKFILETALERSGQNVAQAARSLGMTRQTLRYRIQKYGLRDAGDESHSDTD